MLAVGIEQRIYAGQKDKNREQTQKDFHPFSAVEQEIVNRGTRAAGTKIHRVLDDNAKANGESEVNKIGQRMAFGEGITAQEKSPLSGT